MGMYYVVRLIILGLLGCCNKNTLNLTYKQQKFISHSPAESTRPRCQQMQCLVRTNFLVQKRLSSCYVLIEQKGVREVSEVSFLWVLIELMKALLS